MKGEKKLNITLRNFLSYMLEYKEKFSNKLSKEYSESERYSFIYSCALNTIDEFLHEHKRTLSVIISSQQIISLFKENFMLRHFERVEISLSLSEQQKKIIDQFKFLKENLNCQDKNYIIQNVEDILTSTSI